MSLFRSRKQAHAVDAVSHDETADSQAEQPDVLGAVREAVAQIEDLSSTLADSSEGASVATQEIGQGLFQVAQGAHEQSERAVHAVTSMETLDGAVARITSGADQVRGVVETLRTALADVAQTSQEAWALAEQGGKALDGVQTGMTSIYQSAADSAQR